MRLRLTLSLILALPFAFLILGVAGQVGTPGIVRCAISPGYILGLQLPLSGSFADNLARFVWVALVENEIYYGLLIFLVISLRRH